MDNNNSNEFNYGNPYSAPAGNGSGANPQPSPQPGLYGQTAPAQSNYNQNNSWQNQDFYYQNNQAQSKIIVTQPANGIAIASLVCGIISLLFGCTFGIGAVFAIIAIILGIVAGKKGNKSGIRKGGVITGIIGLVITVISVVFMLVFVGAVLKDAGIDNGFDYIFDYVGDTAEVMSAFRKAAKDPDVKDDPDYKDALRELSHGIELNYYDPEDNIIVEKAYEIMGEDEMEDFIEMNEENGSVIVITMESANSVEISMK